MRIKIYYPSFIDITSDSVSKIYLQSTLDKSTFEQFYNVVFEELTHKNIDLTNLDETIGFLDEIFSKFNSDYNPLLNLNNIVNKIKTHTSMSIGDVIQIDENYYLVSCFGFSKLFF